MGAVFRGIMPGTGKPCALKLVRAGGHERHVRRMEREARLLSQVRHPNLVEVFDMSFREETPWIAMEYIPGATMSQLRRKRKLQDPDRISRLFLQVGAALQALHHQGILHRDIKLGNIMVHESGRPVLMDLGLAVNEDATRLTRTGQLVGTVTYLAPELFQGAAASPASDWWAVGICLYALLELKYPYDQKKVFEMIGERRWRRPAPMKGRHAEHAVAVATRALLTLSPERRLKSFAQLQEVFEKGVWEPPPAEGGDPAEGGEEAGASPGSPPRKAGRSRKSRSRSARIERPGGKRGEPEPAPPAVVQAPAPADPSGPLSGLGRVAPLARAMLVGVALALGILGLLQIPWSSPPPATVPPEPTTPTRPPLTHESPGEHWWEWAREQVEGARARIASGNSAAARRRLGWALSTLERVPDREDWHLLARVELLAALHFDPVGKRRSQAWADLFERAWARLSRSPGGERGSRVRDRLAELRKAGGAFDPDRTPREQFFFTRRPPDKALLWALRSFAPADFPRNLYPQVLAFGYGLPEGFDLDAWARDLRTHPLVRLARVRQESLTSGGVQPGSRERLLQAPEWTPPPGAGEELWLTWLDGLVLGGDLPRLSRGLGAEGIPRSVRLLGGAQRALLRGSAGRIDLSPILDRVEEMDRDPEQAVSPGVASQPGSGIRSYLGLRLGLALAELQSLRGDCPAWQEQLAQTRARVDWEVLERLGAGFLLEQGAPLGHTPLTRGDCAK